VPFAALAGTASAERLTVAAAPTPAPTLPATPPRIATPAPLAPSTGRLIQVREAYSGATSYVDRSKLTPVAVPAT
jgi:hypothetical protein